MLSGDLKSSKEVVCQLLEETIQTVANGGLTSRCTRPELAGGAFFEINVPCGQFRRVKSIVMWRGDRDGLENLVTVPI